MPQRELVLPLCAGCSLLENHAKKIIPVIKCNKQINFKKYLKTLDDIHLSSYDKIHVLIPRAADPYLPLAVVSYLVNNKKCNHNQISIHIHFDYFLKFVKNIFLRKAYYNHLSKYIAHLYIYVDNDKIQNIFDYINSINNNYRNIITRYRDILSLVVLKDQDNIIVDKIMFNEKNIFKRIIILTNSTKLSLLRDINNFYFRFIGLFKFICFNGEVYAQKLQYNNELIFIIINKKNTRNICNAIIIHPSYENNCLSNHSDHNERNDPALSQLKDVLCNYVNITVDVRIRVNGVDLINEDIYNFLKAVDFTHSFSEACRAVHMSYQTIKKRILMAEKALGLPLLFSRRGGSSHGTCELSEYARLLMRIYERVRASAEEDAKTTINRLVGCNSSSNS